MNQILQINDKMGNGKYRKPINIKLIIIIAIIICSIIGVYLIIQNVINGNIQLPGIIEEPTTKIELSKTEENQLVMVFENENGINSITYNWNDEEAKTLKVEGKNKIKKIVDIPIGENTMYLSVLDVNGEETKKQQQFVVDLEKPVIELSVVGNDIKITVTSKYELSSITYGWASQEEKKADMSTYEDRMNFEKKLQIPLGLTALKVTATDVNGSIVEKTQEVKGVTRATTTFKVEGEYIEFTVKGNENIETVQFEFNGKKFLMNKSTFGDTKTVFYKVKLVEGTNYLKVTSTTQSGGIDTSSYEQEYTAR